MMGIRGLKFKMQIRKTYKEVNPELLYREIRDFAQKQGVVVSGARLETYSSPNDSSAFISRGTLSFRIHPQSSGVEKECLRAHIVGSAKSETKLMLDIEEELFPEPKLASLQDDLGFIFGSYEIKPR